MMKLRNAVALDSHISEMREKTAAPDAARVYALLQVHVAVALAK